MMKTSDPGWLRRIMGNCAVVAAALTLAIAVVLGILVIWLGSWKAGMAWAKGHSVYVLADPVAVHDAPGGSRVVTAIRLRNVSTRPVRVLGGRSDCSCVLVEELPFDLRAGESREVRVRLTVPEKKGASFEHSVLLFLSVPGPPVVTTVSGTVGDPR